MLLAALAAALLLLPAAALAHQLDSVGEYRIQIGWQYEPAISGEPNAMQLWVSPLDPSLPVEEQPFRDGITGLRKDLRLELVFDGEKITLPLSVDHDVPGKYYALVSPTEPGYYQVNVLGRVGETVFNKALHAPKVENSEFIRFPVPDDRTGAELERASSELARLDAAVSDLEMRHSQAPGPALGYAALGLAAASAAVSGVALARRR